MIGDCSDPGITTVCSDNWIKGAQTAFVGVIATLFATSLNTAFLTCNLYAISKSNHGNHDFIDHSPYYCFRHVFLFCQIQSGGQLQD